MRIKKIIGIVLSLLMVLTMIPILPIAATELPFTDVQESDWFHNSVQYVYDNGLMNGVSENTFEPQTTMSRAMVVTVLHRMESEPTAEPGTFKDVPGDTWFTNPVAWASADGIVTGYNADTFGPNDDVTREQIATILFRYAGKKGFDVSKRGELGEYTDESQINDWAKDALSWANGEGLVGGFPDHTLAPGANATRAQVATILMRFCEGIAKQATDDPGKTDETIYLVTFESNGGSAVEEQKVKETERAKKPSDPTKEGYTFVGWYSDGEMNTEYDFRNSVSSDLTLYAKWEEKPPVVFTITFESNGGSAVEAQKVSENTAVTQPEDPEKEGYVFVGWYSDEGLSTEYDFNKSVSSDLTLYAKWEENQSDMVDFASANVGDYVTFGHYEQDNNIDNGKEAIEWKVLEKTNGRVLLLSKYGLDCKRYNERYINVTWETCTLRNWLNSDFLNEAFSTSEQSTISTVTLSNPDNPKYGTEGGADTNDRVFLLSLQEVQQYFKLCDTWKDYDGNEWNVDDWSIGGSKDVITLPTFYAVAQGADTNSDYHDEEGKESCWWWLRSPGNYSNYAANIYTFGYVNLGGISVGRDGLAVRPALWVNLTSGGDGGTVTTTYTVTFETNGGSVVDSQKIKENQKATEPTEPTKDGSTFSGWYSDSELNTEYDFNNPVSDDLTLYAKWEKNAEPGVIQDSWEEIIASINDGTYKSKYTIGDTKSLDLGSEGVVDMQIAAFDADELADGSGKAAITWISKQVLKTEHRMNPDREYNMSTFSYILGTGSVGGWEHSEIREWLKNDVKPLIPSTVRKSIKSVTKYSASYDVSNNRENNTLTTDDVWIPSCREVFGTASASYYNLSFETEGAMYSDLFASSSDRIKQKSGENNAEYWWLRSAGRGSSAFEAVYSGSINDGYNSTTMNSVAFGFCI